MKYYSDVTKKLYDSEKELVKAEAEAAKVQAAEDEKKKVRAARAKEVEAAFKAIIEAQNHYKELKNKFIEDYGTFHMSYSQKTPLTTFGEVEALIDHLFNL